MALGHKTGGRKAGTPNRQTREITELLESLGHNPIEAMVRIATDPEASLELRGRMNAELAQYVYPKRKAVEVASDKDAPVMHKVVLEMVRTPEVPPRVSRWIRQNSTPKKRRPLVRLIATPLRYGGSQASTTTGD